MVRTILGAILGYVGVAIFTGLTLGLAYTLMGAEGSFKPASWEPSTAWLMVMFAVSLGAALIAGAIAAWIGRGKAAVLSLMGIILVLGLGMAAARTQLPDPGPRPEEVPMADAMNEARQPLWVALILPFAGAVGVWLGGTTVLSRSAKKDS